MPWVLIDTVAENEAVLELYGKDGLFMIRANGLELMSGFEHESEAALGVLAADVSPSRQPRILVGGLGLGYTAAALVRSLGGRGSVTVAELSGAVIGWFHHHLKDSIWPRAGSDITIVQADIAALLIGTDRYDLVVLDVDNGPEPLVTAGNAKLYSAAGLEALHTCLSADGIALLWSGFESAAFEARAKEAGFAVTCRSFRRARADLSHFIYVLAKDEAALKPA